MKNRAIRILICMFLGVITTIVVAWSFAWLNRIEDSSKIASGLTAIDYKGWQVDIYYELGSKLVWGNNSTSYKKALSWPRRSELFTVKELEYVPDYFLQDRYTHIDRAYRASGWPFIALEAVQEHSVTSARSITEIKWGIPIPESLGASTNQFFYTPDFVALPLKLIPLGFVLDTAIYGVFWLIVFYLRSWATKRYLYLSWRISGVSIVVLLAMGALTTIAVAWLCALCVGFQNENSGQLYQDGKTGIETHRRWNVIHNKKVGELYIASYIEFFIYKSKSTGSAIDMCPNWAQFIVPPKDWIERNDNGSYVIRDSRNSSELKEMREWGKHTLRANGWPMLAMWSSSTQYENGKYSIENHQFTMPGIGNGNLSVIPSMSLPLAPIWFGFAVDTLFYAFLWSWFAVFIFGPKIFIRTWRKRRGKCPMCAYDPRGDIDTGCSECGWNRIGDDVTNTKSDL